MEEVIRHIRIFFKTRFSLHKDKEDETDIIESIRKGIEFRGINVWILIFAIFLASIGLNVNSTAVIIGAMLISPLMGPIMGIGLGLGIFDFELLKLAAKNLAIMVVISLVTSTLYFALSPLSQAQSELLARTTPTIWDVLIALFGGLAGIVAGSSKAKGNAIPGVAIATALMPPLCTAGFGLANGDFYIFIGAFYLFCINGVFISVSTLVVVRLLKFTKHTYLDKRSEKRIRNTISIIVLVTVVPSIFIAYLTVRKAVFEQRVKKYIQDEFNFDRTVVITQSIDYENARIELMLLGALLPQDTIDNRKMKAIDYGLDGIALHVSQGISDTTSVNTQAINADLVQETFIKNEALLREKDKAIQNLRSQLLAFRKDSLPVKNIATEMRALNPNVMAVSIHKNLYYNTTGQGTDTITTANVSFSKKPSSSELNKLAAWLKIRTQADTLRLIPE